MGLNVNYSLLIEGNNSTSYIPEYKNYYKPGFFMKSELVAYILNSIRRLENQESFFLICMKWNLLMSLLQL